MLQNTTSANAAAAASAAPSSSTLAATNPSLATLALALEDGKESKDPPSALQLLLTKQPMATGTPTPSPAPTTATRIQALAVAVNNPTTAAASLSEPTPATPTAVLDSPLPPPPDLQPRKQPVLSRPPSLHPLILKAFVQQTPINTTVPLTDVALKLETLSAQETAADKPPRLPSQSPAASFSPIETLPGVSNNIPQMAALSVNSPATAAPPPVLSSTSTLQQPAVLAIPSAVISSSVVTSTPGQPSQPLSSLPSTNEYPPFDSSLFPAAASSLPRTTNAASSSAVTAASTGTSSIVATPNSTLPRTKLSNPVSSSDMTNEGMLSATFNASLNSEERKSLSEDVVFRNSQRLSGDQALAPSVPSALETLLAPVLTASEKASSLGGVGALESLLAPVKNAAPACGTTAALINSSQPNSGTTPSKVLSISTSLLGGDVVAESGGLGTASSSLSLASAAVASGTPRASADDAPVPSDLGDTASGLVSGGASGSDISSIHTVKPALGAIGSVDKAAEALQYGIVPANSLGVHSLKPEFELPIRGILDFMPHKDPIQPQVTAQISTWPVRKSGFLFRRDLQHLRLAPNTSNYSSLFPSVRPTASTLSTLSTSSNSSAKNIGRSIMALWHPRSKHNINEYGPPQMQQQLSQPHPSMQPQGVVLDARSPSIASTLSYPGIGSGPAEDEEDWSIYYVEVRGRYMFFYLIMPMAASVGQSQQQSPQVTSASMGNLDSPSGGLEANVSNGINRRASVSSTNGNFSMGGGLFQGKRPSSQMSFGSIKEAVKPQIGINKLWVDFSMRTKKAAQNLYQQNLKRPSSSDMRFHRGTNNSPIPPAISQTASSGGQGGYQTPSNTGDRRNSTDSGRSLWSALSPNDIKNAPVCLIICD
ncbi:hypothetical protein BDR26DRAFT_415746 [Obelidium mucronatum]|nr:hypothetical protein BDR26DRAFT_415746 [Obelidium mucronatum]